VNAAGLASLSLDEVATPPPLPTKQAALRVRPGRADTDPLGSVPLPRLASTTSLTSSSKSSSTSTSTSTLTSSGRGLGVQSTPALSSEAKSTSRFHHLTDRADELLQSLKGSDYVDPVKNSERLESFKTSSASAARKMMKRTKRTRRLSGVAVSPTHRAALARTATAGHDTDAAELSDADVISSHGLPILLLMFKPAVTTARTSSEIGLEMGIVRCLLATYGATDPLVQALLSLARRRGRDLPLVKAVVAQELAEKTTGGADSSNLRATLFRGDSAATKMVRGVLRDCCGAWLVKFVAPSVLAAFDSATRYEVDPSKLADGANLAANQEHLTRAARTFVQSVSSAEAVAALPPPALRLIAVIDEVSDATFGLDEAVEASPTHALLAGFIFLRFACPALIAPHMYGLTVAAPPAQAQRALVLLAKCVQAAANNITAFGAKEPYMAPFNGWLEETKPAMADLYDRLVAHATNDAASDDPAGDFTSEVSRADADALAVVVPLLRKNLEGMERRAMAGGFFGPGTLLRLRGLAAALGEQSSIPRERTEALAKKMTERNIATVASVPEALPEDQVVAPSRRDPLPASARTPAMRASVRITRAAHHVGRSSHRAPQRSDARAERLQLAGSLLEQRVQAILMQLTALREATAIITSPLAVASQCRPFVAATIRVCKQVRARLASMYDPAEVTLELKPALWPDLEADEPKLWTLLHALLDHIEEMWYYCGRILDDLDRGVTIALVQHVAPAVRDMIAGLMEDPAVNEAIAASLAS